MEQESKIAAIVEEIFAGYLPEIARAVAKRLERDGFRQVMQGGGMLSGPMLGNLANALPNVGTARDADGVPLCETCGGRANGINMSIEHGWGCSEDTL